MNYVFLACQVAIALVIMHVILGAVAYLILLERKVASWIQDRLGPNRAGPHGLLQPIADGVKFVLKEEFIPKNADVKLFILAPILILTPALCGFAILPWGGILRAGSSIFGYITPVKWAVMAADPSIGVLWVLAMAGLSTYGIVLGGWASGSKFSFLGGLRATAQMLSYEIPLALALMTVVLLSGTMNLESIVENQDHYFGHILPAWNIFIHPIAFVLFVTTVFAESNRAPFDLAECEAELVGGYHTEYSSMKFALFFLAEYFSMVTGAAVAVCLFLGGWHLPYLDHVLYGHTQPFDGGWLGVLLKFLVFSGKIVLFCFFYMWIRWTLPRFRFDQLMNLAWRGMIPLALADFVLTAVVVFLKQIGHEGGGGALGAFAVNNAALLVFIFNIALAAAAILILSQHKRPALNERVPVPGSRYNPELARRALALESA
jgi:NADH-quinone oxidoreductase subunit H